MYAFKIYFSTSSGINTHFISMKDHRMNVKFAKDAEGLRVPKSWRQKKKKKVGKFIYSGEHEEPFLWLPIRPLCKNLLLGKSQKLSLPPGPGPINWVRAFHVTLAMYMEADVCVGGCGSWV